MELAQVSKDEQQQMIGKTSRMQRLFDGGSGKTLTIAVDHGASVGPVEGIEKIEEVFERLDPWADAWLMTKGALRHSYEPDGVTGVILRATGGTTGAQGYVEGEGSVLSVEEAVMLDADAVAATVLIGTTFERDSLVNLAGLAEMCGRWQMPLVAVLGAGVVQERMSEADYWALGARVAAEHGADLVHTFWVEEGFEKVVAGCPVPVIVSGAAKRQSVDEYLVMIESAVEAGARGIVMGADLWQAEHPEAMAEAVGMVLHQGATVAEAMEAYREAETEHG